MYRYHLKFIGNVLNKPWIRQVSRIREKPSRNHVGAFGWSLMLFPVGTFALGTWQIRRKAWKESLINELKERVASHPKDLPYHIDDVQKLEYYPVRVRGTFQHDKELYIGPRTLIHKGEAASTSSLLSQDQNKTQGYLVVTPFKLSDRDQTILVNRGWVSSKRRNPMTRLKGQVKEEVDVIGVVRLHENRPVFMPSSKATSDTLLYRDLDLMSLVTGSSPIFLDATIDFPAPDGPIGGQTRVSMRNEHLSYILTWYSLSAITSYMWVKQFLKK